MRAVLGLGLPPGGAAADYDPASEAIFTAMNPAPSTARKALINTAVTSLIASGVWAKLDMLQVYAAPTANSSQNALVDWRTPSRIATAVNSPTFTADVGVAGNGSTSYINTAFNPGDGDSYNYALNDALVGVWCTQDVADNGVLVGGRQSSSAAQTFIIPRNGSDQAAYRINQGTASGTSSNTSGDGLFSLRRTGSGAYELRRNAASVGTQAFSSTAIFNGNFFVGALNTNGSAGSHSARQAALCYAGSALSDAEIEDFYDAMNIYLAAIAP